MIRHGMLIGLGVLLAVALLEALARYHIRSGTGVRAGVEGDISEQVWQVLAEARRIVEEA